MSDDTAQKLTDSKGHIIVILLPRKSAISEYAVVIKGGSEIDRVVVIKMEVDVVVVE